MPNAPSPLLTLRLRFLRLRFLRLRFLRLRSGQAGQAGQAKEGKEKVDIVNKLVNTYKDDKRHCRDDHTTIVIPNLPFSVILANARIQCCSLRKAEEKAKALDPLLDWIHSLIGSPIRSGTASGTSVEDDRKRQRKKQKPWILYLTGSPIRSGTASRSGTSVDPGSVTERDRGKSKDPGSSITNVEDDETEVKDPGMYKRRG